MFGHCLVCLPHATFTVTVMTEQSCIMLKMYDIMLTMRIYVNNRKQSNATVVVILRHLKVQLMEFSICTGTSKLSYE